MPPIHSFVKLEFSQRSNGWNSLFSLLFFSWIWSRRPPAHQKCEHMQCVGFSVMKRLVLLRCVVLLLCCCYAKQIMAVLLLNVKIQYGTLSLLLICKQSKLLILSLENIFKPHVVGILRLLQIHRDFTAPKVVKFFALFRGNGSHHWHAVT